MAHVLVGPVLVDLELVLVIDVRLGVVEDDVVVGCFDEAEVVVVVVETVVGIPVFFRQEHALETREGPHVDGMYVGKLVVAVCV